MSGVLACLVSFLHFIASKTSALCETLPSTPCCGCWLDAWCSCSVRFSSGDPEPPLDAARASPVLLLVGCCFLPLSCAACPGVLPFFPVLFFFLVGPLPLGGPPLEAYSRTSGESNHHRQSVSGTRSRHTNLATKWGGDHRFSTSTASDQI